MTADPYGTGELRRAVLDAWAASPARFREDANAEEDAVLGGYRDRLVVELCQNAVDAARAAGVPARVLLRLSGDLLEAANTGAPLTAAGVQALSTLRASAKRDDDGTVGRFGVGFAAVLAVTDAPVIVSGGSGDHAVGWSAARTATLVQGLPSLAEELGRRAGGVPVLRLPFALAATDPLAAPPPEGYDTVVRLPLRDAAQVRQLLDDLDPTLPLVLPGLAELAVETAAGTRVLRLVDGGDVLELDGVRWLLAEVVGELPAGLLAGRGVEERERRGFRVRALVPDGDWPAGVERVLRAPTPTEEPLSLPVLLSVPVPLEPTRRRSAPGPLRDHLLDVAAGAVAALAHRVAGRAVLRLVPTGLPAGEVDAALCRSLLARLRADPPLPGHRLLDLGRATPAVHTVLAEVVEGLLDPAWPVASPPLAALGVERLDTAGVVDLLAGVDRPPSWWRTAYDALADAPDREALGALPVPLADGRRAPGPRGLLVAPPELDLAGFDGPDGVLTGLRLVHPDATHDLLLSLGAVEATPRVLLQELRPRVEASYDDDDTEVAGPVLSLVRAARLRPGEEPWLAELALTDADGDPAPAGELVLPDGPLARVLLPDGPLGLVDRAVVQRWGGAVLVACGVADGLLVVRGDDEVAALDDGEEWLDRHAPPGAEPCGVRDLELLRWPDALPLLGSLPGDALPYARWWCSRHPVLDGRLPAEVLDPAADPLLRGLYDEAPPGVDVTGLGCLVALPVADDAVLDLLDRLGDTTRVVTRAQVRALHAHVAAHPPAGDPALGVRAVDSAGRLVVVEPRSAVLVDRPDLLPLLGSRAVVPAPAAAAAVLCGVLDVPLASALVAGVLVSEDPLVVLDADGHPTPVLWWLGPDGALHAPTPEGRGRGLAWLSGRWADRLDLVERARRPDLAALLDAEGDL